ncbi:MAG: hypothetical protein R3F24_12405 [Gammaproteobacteria bacterium]
MKPALQLRLGQQLTMTPQLQQAIRLLQLPVAELNAQLEQLLAENVMLDVEETEASTADGNIELTIPAPTRRQAAHRTTKPLQMPGTTATARP